MIGYLLSSKYLLVASEASNCAPGLIKPRTIRGLSTPGAHHRSKRTRARRGAACLTCSDALKRIVGTDGVEVDAGEVERAAAPAARGEEEAEQPAPVAAVHLQHRRRVHGCPTREEAEGFGEGRDRLGEAETGRRLALRL